MTTLTLLDAVPRQPLDSSADGLLIVLAAVLLAVGLIAAVAIAIQARVGVAARPTRSEHGLPIDSWGSDRVDKRMHAGR